MSFATARTSFSERHLSVGSSETIPLFGRFSFASIGQSLSIVVGSAPKSVSSMS